MANIIVTDIIVCKNNEKNKVANNIGKMSLNIQRFVAIIVVGLQLIFSNTKSRTLPPSAGECRIGGHYQ